MTNKHKLALCGGITVVAIGAAISIALLRHKPAPAPTTMPQELTFLQVTNEGRAALENLNPQKAVSLLETAARLEPTRADANLNLANAYLHADRPEDAARAAEAALKLDPNSPAASYVLGSAHLRLAHFEPAVQALQQAVRMDLSVSAAHFQLGRAYQGLSDWQQAANEMREVIAREPQHPAAHYILGQLLIQLGDRRAADEELKRHHAISANQPNVLKTPTTFERSIYTAIQTLHRLSEQPDLTGIAVRFTDVTSAWLGANGGETLVGPAAAIDLKGDGCYVIVTRSSKMDALRLLRFGNGSLSPIGDEVPLPGSMKKVTAALVGDLQNDGVPDLVLLGEPGSAVFAFTAGGKVTDLTAPSGLANVSAVFGVLADLDFTGKLGLWTIPADGSAVHAFRNTGKSIFKDLGTADGLPGNTGNAKQLIVEDWNRDDLPDLIIGRANAAPSLLQNRRNGPLEMTDPGVRWPIGEAIATGDLNNDLRSDLVIAASDGIHLVVSGLSDAPPVLSASNVRKLFLIDYDNDGWLDIVSAGDFLQIWRNLGRGEFSELTESLGVKEIHLLAGGVIDIVAADLDSDGDTDLLLDLGPAGARILRNDGGNANRQTKFRLTGKRSNANGLGAQLELTSDHWQTIRTFTGPTLEVGHGKHPTFDTATVHWFDLVVTQTNVKAASAKDSPPVVIKELELPTGSCPYLYAWDGKRFRFITDILGAAPLGLRITDGHFIDADTEELVWIGNESMFVPRDGKYVLQVTEELREVLYLDHASLVIADHPAGTEMHSTGKLLPGKPFPPPELITLGNRVPLRRAVIDDGKDVTAALQAIDEIRVSPPALRLPQLRGLAQPHAITLDFETLPVDRPLVLALTGWLRFGGGMANVGASHDPALPFPFPKLEAKSPGGWTPVDVTVGAPAGKTKTITVDLTHKLPAETSSLRLSTAFEIHWDRIALFEPSRNGQANATSVHPDRADLQWHGFGHFEAADASRPLTPIWESPSQSPPWLITPSGWCTRYGDVKELLKGTDNSLVLLNGGDALELSFDASSLPKIGDGDTRDFFLRTSGWDKDADYHVEQGWTVDPLPWHGLNDQQYGRENRPKMPNDAWIKQYNTRWVPPGTQR